MGNQERAKVDHVIKKKNTPIFYIANFLAMIFLYGKMIKYKKNKVIIILIIIIGKENHNRHFVNN